MEPKYVYNKKVIKIEDTRQDRFGEKLIEWGYEGWEPILVYNNFLMIFKKNE